MFYLEVQKEVHGGHGASSEKVLCHPLGVRARLDIKGVGMLAMAKHLQEQQPTGFQPGRHALEELLIVLHMLEYMVNREKVNREKVNREKVNREKVINGLVKIR